MNLVEALGLREAARLAIVGAGGKTTALFHLARRLPGPAWVTTTTHLGTDQASLADRHFVVESALELRAADLLAQKVSLVSGPATPDERLSAPAAAVLEQLRKLANQAQASLLVEADGARSRPLKAPAEYEPQIPPWADLVIVVAGLSALGQPLGPDWVHRPARFAELSQVRPGEPVTLAALRDVLLHPEGGLKGIPAGARRVVLLNQADSPNLQAAAAQIIPELLAGGYDGVFVGSLKTAPEAGMWYD